MGEPNDIDRGWAFAVVICGCLTQILTTGLSYTSAIFYATFLDAFDESPVMTAWTVNLVIFVFYVNGILANCLVSSFGHRKTIAVGGLVSTTGLIGCCFAPNLTVLLFSYGVVTGFGFALVYFPVFPVIASYFQNYRKAAFALCSAGAGIGQFVYPNLLEIFIEGYEWRGAFLLLAAINLNSLVIAAALMPPRKEVAEIEVVEIPTRKPTHCLKNQLKSLLLFRKPRWNLFCISYCLFAMALSGINTHITNHARLLGFTKFQSAFLCSILGIGALLGRFMSGLVGQIPNIQIVGWYISLTAFQGMVVIVMPFNEDYTWIAVCCILIGLSVGSNGIYAEVVIHIIGVTNLASGVGYTSIAAAIGMGFGGPLAAVVYEIQGTYNLSFATVGIIALLGSLLNLPAWLTMENGRIHQRRPCDERNEWRITT